MSGELAAAVHHHGEGPGRSDQEQRHQPHGRPPHPLPQRRRPLDPQHIRQTARQVR